LILLAAVFAVASVVGVVTKFLNAEDCYDRGGIVVGPMLRGQHCVMPEDAKE
jgi:hypothetical protein